MKLAKTDADGYYKNTETNTVINNNNSEYAAFIQNRERIKQMQSFQEQIENLKNECKELREFCIEISERFNVKTNQ